jgi:hypothetical protein
VHGPVGPTGLAELPGAVQRVDDPDPLGGVPGGRVGALLGQHRVAGAAGGQLGQQECVGLRVTGPAVRARGAQLQQQRTGPLGQLLGQQRVIHVYVYLSDRGVVPALPHVDAHRSHA